MILLHGWHSLKQTFPVRKAEWVNSFTLLALSIVMLQDDLFERSAGYAAMARFAPQEFWQWTLFALASFRLTVLAINGAYSRTPLFRWIGAFLSCFAWWQLSTGLSSNLGVGFVLAGALLAHEALNFRQAFIEDQTQAGVNEGLREVERRNAIPRAPDAHS